MGQLKTHDYVLMGIDLFPGSRIMYDERDELARSMGLSALTIRRSLTDLKKEGAIIKIKEEGRQYFQMTIKGMEEAKALHSLISSHYFTPPRHGVPSSIKLVDVLDLIGNPFFKAFLLKLYFEKDEFDLVDTLKTFEVLEKETSIYNLFEKIEIFQGSSGMPNFVHSFIEASLVGVGENELKNPEAREKKSIEVLLLEADMKVVRGNFNEALSLYDSVIRKPGLPQELWFVANIGRVRTLGKMGLREEWEKALEETRRTTENRIVHAFLNQMEADLLGIVGDHERAKELFEKAIGTFRYYRYQIFLSIAYNNYGILMFNMEMYDEAERYWKKAKRFASRCKSRYNEANATTNLASIMRIKGDLEGARRFLENAKKTYLFLNNLESISVLEYNVSLIHLAEGDLDLAIDLFNRSCFITFPLLSEYHREERFLVFKREAEKHKYTPLRRGPKYDLVYIG
ncbi:MAG: tetratricopeptide repeat protein [Candidatus Thermoplasmatota archaeon]|nr:tetratricopeptide repeat protein [Candidatus Thermoplasmatota archaeon]